jgi:alpha-amylase
MPARISLALTFHNHQPAGNFGWVFEDVCTKAYEPMVAALERHPTIHVGLHYSGPLLDWLKTERPGLVDRIRVLADRGQVEVLGGPLYEPVLAALPVRDRIGQLERMAAEVEATFGRRPAGAWLPERVWEPDVPSALAAAGYAWTILDDAHLRAAAIADEAMWGPYVADDQGEVVTVFGTEQGLRYRIPFKAVDAIIEYLREHATEAGDRLGTMGDDGEKFGAWPDTFEHCWGGGRWVDRFFEALEANADWLATVRPSDWLVAHAPIGRAAIPTCSYAEMNQWSGGFWRNFQVRYREINDLQKQMLRISSEVAAMPAGPARAEALDHLYRGQSNDCYWHGLFGGIYIPHMRSATLGQLIAAESIVDREAGSLEAAELIDLDLDRRDEVRLATAGQVVTVDLDEGAGVGSWDIRAARFPLASVLRRRPEAYHESLRHAAESASESAGAASIHEVVRTKEAGLADRLVYDAYERRGALVRVLPVESSAAEWRAGGGPDLADFVDGAHELVTMDPRRLVVRRDGVAANGTNLRLTKELRLASGATDPTLRVSLELEHRGGPPLTARIGIEWPTLLLGGGGNPAAWWSVDGTRSPHDGSGVASGIDRIAQGNDWLGVEVEASVGPAADAWWAPIETVSNSEAGFERVYQGSALLVSWPVSLDRGGIWRATVEQQVRVRGSETGPGHASARDLRVAG